MADFVHEKSRVIDAAGGGVDDETVQLAVDSIKPVRADGRTE